MKHLDEQGSTGLLVALLVTLFLLLGSLIFGFWSFTGRQDYKNNADKKVATAVQVAEQKLSTKKDNEFAEAQKSPVKVFSGPSAYGSISLSYPKTWSAYADITGQSNQPVNAYFNPNFVPATSTRSTYALRLQVTPDSYDQQLQQFDSLVQTGKVKVKPYSFPSVKGVTGVRIEGNISSTTQGVMILMPLRDKTIKLWTETDQFQKDFATYVLPNFKFSP